MLELSGALDISEICRLCGGRAAVGVVAASATGGAAGYWTPF